MGHTFQQVNLPQSSFFLALASFRLSSIIFLRASSLALAASWALADLAGVDVLLLFLLFVFNGLVAGVAVCCSGTTLKNKREFQ